MKELFLQILNMSINASYLILAILIIRFIFKSLPKTSRIILWVIVGIKLICPFTIESVFSLIPTKKVVYITETIQPELIINTGNQQVNQTIEQTITNTINSNVNENTTAILDFTTILSIIWIIGIVLILTYSIISVIQLKKKIKESVILKENIYLCDHIDACFVFGIFNPKIYLPSSMNNEDLKYIIAHEKAHIQRKDYVYKPLAFLLLSIHWFNPMVWIAYKCFCSDLELACDEKVLVDFGLESKKEYSNTLINYSDQTHLGVCPLAFSENNVKSRVVSILKYKKPNKWMIAVGVLICAVFIACFMTNPKEIKTTLVKYKPNENLESLATVDDIEGWDIPLNEVKSVVVKSYIYNSSETREITLSKEETTQLIQAFNAIQNKDILEIYTEPLYGAASNCTISVETDNGTLHIATSEYGYIWPSETCYVTHLQTEFYNTLRDLNEKYNLGFKFYEMILRDYEETIVVGSKNHIVVSSNAKVNDTRIALEYEPLPEYHISIQELLKPYENKLAINDVVETEDMRIKIIYIKDNQVIAVAVEILEEKKEVIEEEKEYDVEKVQWHNHSYSKLIPNPKLGKLNVLKQEENEFKFVVEKISKEKFNWYVNECEKFGFKIQSNHDNSYFLENKEEYRLNIEYDEEKQEMSVRVHEPLFNVEFKVQLNNKKTSNDAYQIYLYINDEINGIQLFEGKDGNYKIYTSFPPGEHHLKLSDPHSSKEIETSFEVNGQCEITYELDCYDDRIEIANFEKEDRSE